MAPAQLSGPVATGFAADGRVQAGRRRKSATWWNGRRMSPVGSKAPPKSRLRSPTCRFSIPPGAAMTGRRKFRPMSCGWPAKPAILTSYWRLIIAPGRRILTSDGSGQSVEHIDAGAAIYDEARHARHRHQYMGHDPGVCLLSFNGPAQMLLGHLAQGLQSIEACVARARRLAHPPSLGIALFACCQFRRFFAAMPPRSLGARKRLIQL